MASTSNTSSTTLHQQPLVLTESPISGVNIELATLLINAIKVRRKYLSKSSSSSSSDGVLVDNDAAKEATTRQQILQTLEGNAEDATTAFLNELRRQVEGAKTNKLQTTQSKSSQQSKSTNAVINCCAFLLETLADSSNSYHLRRAALVIIKEVLTRSSDARCHLASGRNLMEFVEIIRAIGSDDDDAELNTEQQSSPKVVFQQEATELIHHLADKYARLYNEFTVASMLLGDVSISLSTTSNATYSHRGTRQSQPRRNDARALRRERDIALDRGMKACQILEQMIERADEYFGVLVPRFGGFAVESGEAIDARVEEVIKSEDGVGSDESVLNEVDPPDNSTAFNDDAEEDDDSINWEAGDMDESDSMDDSILHQSAVEQTLTIMERSGALQEGGLSVNLDTTTTAALAHTNMATNETANATNNKADPRAKARIKLQKLVQKLSSQRLPRLNSWIHALSHADLMEERAVVDPASSIGTASTTGPVSLVLLSQEKRALRLPLLKQLMKVRGEVEEVLRSAAKIGVLPDGIEPIQSNDKSYEDRAESQAVNQRTLARNTNTKKRKWLSGTFVAVGSQPNNRKKQTQTKYKFKVFYRKK